MTGTASVAVPYASMAAADNNVGITTTATAAAGNFDGDGNSYAQTALAAAGLTPGAALTVLAGSGHMVMLERPDELCELLA